MTVITVVIVDDHVIFRQGLKGLLEKHSSIKVVGEAGNASDAIEMIKRLKPDVGILDISLGDKSGFDVAEKLLEDNVPVNLAFLTMYKEKEYFAEALRIGVKVYVLKDNTSSELIEGVKAAYEKKFYISPELSIHMAGVNENQGYIASGLDDLTQAEKRVLTMIGENKTSRQIAEKLELSVRTIQNHRSNICSKLNISGMNSLLEFALKNRNKIL